jgi:hypothetical protein
MNRMGVMFQDKDGKLSRDLSWMDWPYLRRLSPDGKKTILFDEEGNAYGRYETMIRDTDRSPAVRLGEGYSAALSRDKAWAQSVKVTVQANFSTEHIVIRSVPADRPSRHYKGLMLAAR